MSNKEKEEVKLELKEKMGRIRDLWNNYILEYDSLAKKVNNPKNTEFKYVGTILGNFIDTFDIIYGSPEVRGFGDEYSYNMSLMQSIYIQQDFIEELLHIFRCKTVKGDLQQDENYRKNRDIRNELMGHPIRKIEGELISTTLLAYNGSSGCITYSRYHKDNNFQFEKIEHRIKDIIERHTDFLHKYFDKILTYIRRHFKSFMKCLKQVETGMDNMSFNKLIEFTSTHFETIHNNTYGYKKDSLLYLFEKRTEHQRYQHFIDYFLRELKESISGHLSNLEEKFSPQPKKVESEILMEPIFITNEDGSIELNITTSAERDKKPWYGYELGKLATNLQLFDFNYSVLKAKCPNNELVLSELEHMKSNIGNTPEYYSALQLIRTELNDDDF